ncbi:hypothetical protein GIB67_034495 [Kingdonia uniflora]|uniref:Dolichol-phosphate mannosyltransferase subunit 3 n=1 Tax=Kingdonia uniflora TaxID=39325 RepID=A0A7J7PB99_9MAGN|nr:hypothetical protein GIB67_034495 [Kingdonia uniflora]
MSIFEWDPVKQTVVAADEKWDELLEDPESREKFKRFQDRSPKWDFENLSMIVGTNRAIRSFAVCVLDSVDIKKMDSGNGRYSLPGVEEDLNLDDSEGVKLGNLLQSEMKHFIKILSLFIAITAFWIGLLKALVIPRTYTWLLPVYFVVLLGCYGLLMVGIGLMRFPTCPQEARLLQQDILEAKEFLKPRGVDVGSD